jgi:diguanylate cyclase (GGDEF)-like protein
MSQGFFPALWPFLLTALIIVLMLGLVLTIFLCLRRQGRLSNQREASLIREVDVSRRKFHELQIHNRELQHSNQILEYLAQYDGLTKIPNRRHFVERYEQEWRLAFRERLEISLIMLDIDNFKKYNDAYGHLEGDNCLRMVAEILRSELKRPTDFLARYGGEEFVIILPKTAETGALQTAKRLSRAVIDYRIPHRDSPVAQYVTISLGISTTVPGHIHDMNLLIRRADEALYQAKNTGKRKAVYLPFPVKTN